MDRGRCRLAVAIAIVIGLLVALAPARGQESCAEGAFLKAGEASGGPGDTVVVPVSGKVDCEATGFSFAVGHDESVLSFVEARPSALIAEYAGGDLVFQSLGGAGKGYSAVFALFDISFPITVPPRAFPEETILAQLTYEIRQDAPAGPLALLNRTLVYGGGNPIANIFSRSFGLEPVTPELIDGRVVVSSPAEFIRGDADGSGVVDLTDAVQVLAYLFTGDPPPSCPDAADANDDGEIDLADPVVTLFFLFAGAAMPPPSPGPGVDPTPDGLGDCGE